LIKERKSISKKLKSANKSKYTNKKIILILLGLLVLFHVVNNIIILHNDTVPISGDEAQHYANSLISYNKLKDNFLSNLIVTHVSYPPLFYYTTLPLYMIFGTSPDIAVMINIAYLIILIGAAYGIGKELGNPISGLMSAFIVSMFITIFGYSRIYTLEIALASLVCLSIYLLIKTKEFTNRKFSILLGITLGLGMLTKWSFSIYVTGPILYYLAHSFISQKSINRKSKGMGTKLKNLIIVAVIALCFMTLWYPTNINHLNSRAKVYSGTYTSTEQFTENSNTTVKDIKTTPVLSAYTKIRMLLFYPKMMFNHQLGYLYFVLFIISLFYIIITSKKGWQILLSWIIGSYLILTAVAAFSFLRTTYFFLPALPAAAIMIGLMISGLKNKTLRNILIILIILFSLIQFASHSYSSNPIFSKADPDNYNDGMQAGLLKSRFIQNEKNAWKAKEISDAIFTSIENYTNSNVNITLLVDFHDFSLGGFVMNYELYHKENLNKREVILTINEPLGQCGLGACIYDYKIIESMLLASNIIITQNYTQPLEGPTNKTVALMQQAVNQHANLFKTNAKFKLPNENWIFVMQRK